MIAVLLFFLIIISACRVCVSYGRNKIQTIILGMPILVNFFPDVIIHALCNRKFHSVAIALRLYKHT